MAVFLSKSTSFYNGAHLRRVDTLVPDASVQARSWGPGLVPLALHGPNIVRLLSHRIHKPSPCSTLVAENKSVALNLFLYKTIQYH